MLYKSTGKSGTVSAIVTICAYNSSSLGEINIGGSIDIPSAFSSFAIFAVSTHSFVVIPAIPI